MFSNALEVDLWRSCGGLRCLGLATVTLRVAALVGPSSLVTLEGDRVLGVDPAFDRAALMRRTTPPMLRFGVAASGGAYERRRGSGGFSLAPLHPLGPRAAAADPGPRGLGSSRSLAA